MAPRPAMPLVVVLALLGICGAVARAQRPADAVVGAVGRLDVDRNAEGATHAVATKDALVAESLRPPLLAYPTTFGFITCVIVFIYGHRGFWVVLSVMVYLTALATMKLTVKWVFVEYAFAFPKFLTGFHFFCSGLTCFLVRLRARSLTGAGLIAVPTVTEVFAFLLPISLATSVSVGADNMSLEYCSVAFNEMLSSTTCVFTVGLVILIGLPFNKWLLLPTAAVAMGCAISSVGEVNASLTGMLLVCLANTARSSKATFQQKLMTGESQERFDPCTLLMWVSVPSTILMFSSSFLPEGLKPMRHLAAMSPDTLRGFWMAVGASCINAVTLNLAQLFVTKELGAVGSQLVGQFKAVLTVLGGMALFGDRVTTVEIVGFAEVLLGVYAFSVIDGGTPKKCCEPPPVQPEALIPANPICPPATLDAQ